MDRRKRLLATAAKAPIRIAVAEAKAAMDKMARPGAGGEKAVK